MGQDGVEDGEESPGQLIQAGQPRQPTYRGSLNKRAYGESNEGVEKTREKITFLKNP